MTLLLSVSARLFDRLQHFLDTPWVHRAVGNVIIASFLIGLTAIEMNRQGLLPAALAAALPRSHFFSIRVAFDFVLLVETVRLIFSLGRSVANSVGKQMELFALILLREGFEELTHLDEPVHWAQVGMSVGPMVADAIGALMMFIGLSLYYRLQRHRPITSDPTEQTSFVAAKKLTGLVLLATLLALVAQAAVSFREDGGAFVFDDFYTLLIFSDVWIVLLSLRATSRFEIVFRNSSFAAATIFMRLSLTAPPYISPALAVLAVLFTCGVSLAFNLYSTSSGEQLA